ncbi:hypothetical protein DID88_005044 [Monilinia fructigena]|uniref:Major facilitator superfamily (MFS) profile domain-containing protein n=1 Tax=Monilinia fructigena TaxID=38457 RepID=A0A395IVX0_9HELO|nr:hypothetical protein DID88_005044 [Monilinia fructigena]
MGDSVTNAPSYGEPRQTSLYDSTTDIDAEDDGQKRLEFYGQSAIDPSLKSAIDVSSPIVYHYLTFETSIPSPTSNISSTGSSESAPMRPELKKYTSPFDWSESRKTMHPLPLLYGDFRHGLYRRRVLSSDQANDGTLASFGSCDPGMMVARFFVGCGSSVFSTMVGGVISDIHHKEARNTPMALFSGAALFGTGLGPLVSGFIAQNISWRWVFWVQAITNGLLLLAIILFFPETRGSILLSKKAQCLNKWYEYREQAGFFGIDMPTSTSYEKFESQRIRWKVKSDEDRESLLQMVQISLYRPFHLLFTEPVVFFFSLWVAFAWAVLYLTFGSIPLVFEKSHGFDPLSSLSYQDRCLAKYLNWSSKDVQNPGMIRRNIDLSSPEGRLYFACFESALLPIGLFWFGWTQFPSIPWIVPTLATGCATMGIYSIYLATFNYLADTYHRYASSALAAQSFCRNILGGIFPLITPILFNGITFQGAASLLGGVGALLTIKCNAVAYWKPAEEGTKSWDNMYHRR